MPESLNKHLQRFLHFLEYEKKYSSLTIKAYENDLSQFSAYAAANTLTNINDIKSTHVREWIVGYVEDGKSPTSLKRKKSSLQSFFKWAIRNKLTTNNPTALIPLPKIPKRIPQVLEQQAQEDLNLSQIDIEYKNEWQKRNTEIIITLLYQTGMRRAEICQLNDTNIDYSRKVISVVGKGRKERLIPIGKQLIQLLKSYQTDRNAQFDKHPTFLVTESNRPIYDQYIYRTVKKVLSFISKLKKKSPHILRHTFATTLLNNGADISAIKDLLGHSSLAATQIYTHNNIEELKKQFRKAHPRS